MNHTAHANRFLEAFASPMPQKVSRPDLLATANALCRAQEKGAMSREDLAALLEGLLASYIHISAQDKFLRLTRCMERKAWKWASVEGKRE